MTTTQQVTDEALLKLEAPSNAIKLESEKTIIPRQVGFPIN
jgi:hypothetical protein